MGPCWPWGWSAHPSCFPFPAGRWGLESRSQVLDSTEVIVSHTEGLLGNRGRGPTCDPCQTLLPAPPNGFALENRPSMPTRPIPEGAYRRCIRICFHLMRDGEAPPPVPSKPTPSPTSSAHSRCDSACPLQWGLGRVNRSWFLASSFRYRRKKQLQQGSWRVLAVLLLSHAFLFLPQGFHVLLGELVPLPPPWNSGLSVFAGWLKWAQAGPSQSAEG